MKKFLLLSSCLLVSLSAVAMENQLPTIKSVDDLPQFCLSLRKLLREQPVFDGSNPLVQGPSKVLPLENYTQLFNFRYFSNLANDYLGDSRPADCTFSASKKVSNKCVGIDDATRQVIKLGLTESADAKLDLEVLEQAYANALKSLKMGWFKVDPKTVSMINAMTEDYLVLAKQQSPCNEQGPTSISDNEDYLIENLISFFVLGEKIHFESGLWRRAIYHETQYRYLWIRKDACEEFQARFGFEIAEFQAQQTAARTLIMPTPAGLQTTPLHGAVQADPRTLSSANSIPPIYLFLDYKHKRPF